MMEAEACRVIILSVALRATWSALVPRGDSDEAAFVGTGKDGTWEGSPTGMTT